MSFKQKPTPSHHDAESRRKASTRFLAEFTAVIMPMLSAGAAIEDGHPDQAVLSVRVILHGLDQHHDELLTVLETAQRKGVVPTGGVDYMRRAQLPLTKAEALGCGVPWCAGLWCELMERFIDRDIPSALKGPAVALMLVGVLEGYAEWVGAGKPYPTEVIEFPTAEQQAEIERCAAAKERMGDELLAEGARRGIDVAAHTQSLRDREQAEALGIPYTEPAKREFGGDAFMTACHRALQIELFEGEKSMGEEKDADQVHRALHRPGFVEALRKAVEVGRTEDEYARPDNVQIRGYLPLVLMRRCLDEQTPYSVTCFRYYVEAFMSAPLGDVQSALLVKGLLLNLTTLLLEAIEKEQAKGFGPQG